MRHTGARRHAPYGAEFVIVQMTIGKQPGTKQKKQIQVNYGHHHQQWIGFNYKRVVIE